MTASNPGVEGSAREGAPLCLHLRLRGAPGMGAPRRGSPPLLSFLPEQRLHGEEECPLRLGAGLPAWPRGGTTPRAPRRSRVPRWQRLEAQATRPLHAPSAELRASVRPGWERGHGWGGAAPAGRTAASPTGPGKPGTRRGSRCR